METGIKIEPELLLGLYWGNGYTQWQISDIFGCGHGTIQRRMIEYGIPCRTAGYAVTDFIFNDRQKEIFEGCMLGDGSLEWITNYCRFENCDIHKEYLVWLQHQLGIEHISKVKPKYDSAGYAYHHELRTSVIPSLLDEHKRWYPYETRRGTHENRQTKIIPNDIEITPIKMLFWYLGDGNYHKKRNVAHFTNYLIFDDWMIMLKKICKLLDVNGGISINKHRKDKNGIQIYNLRLNKDVTIKFFDMVDSLDFDIPNCYQYKFGR